MLYKYNDEEEQLPPLTEELIELIQGQTNFISNASNMASLIFYSLKDLNWAGFYMLSGDELILGPFQGKPACQKIDLGKGVCGSSAKNLKPILVNNVHEFPGHIACDPMSRSEMVVPIIFKQKLIGVLDIDSPIFDRFTNSDLELAEDMISIILENSDIESISNYYA
jgi:GAF domain-containing protein